MARWAHACLLMMMVIFSGSWTAVDALTFPQHYTQKRAITTALYLDILLSWITVRICAVDWSVFMENGEMGSRVSADDDGDFQRIVDRSGRAHISTALHGVCVRIMHWARRIEQEIDRVLQHISGAQQLKGKLASEAERLQKDHRWQDGIKVK
ncbi:voltage-dependent calcium channel subunit alpha-2 delta-2-like protein [Labeo rohita]|uniref:Voltage-dependent calcium channel subunit alpha-2 delta-2-like protein n=1 Tax=Labeo rohita TaxID=84645 RepID=A0A498LWV3_LABRO|nr:voltage-dependent calcium channel subunit alpha-2 delta-2-like protein [Labeo rohita]